MQTCALDGAATGTSLNFNYIVQYSLPLGHILSQLNPLHTFTPDVPMVCLNITLYSMLTSSG